MIRGKHLLFYACLVLLAGCIENYQPPAISGNVDIIVVDGFLNSTNNSAMVLLSRAAALTSGAPEPEAGASIKIESDNGAVFTLSEASTGSYLAQDLPLIATDRYRLKIHTQRNQDYISEYITLNNSPTIDSVSWREEKGGLTFFVNTHDPENTAQYYLWSYEETWLYIASFFSTYKMVDGVAVERPYDERIYECFRSLNSTQILVGSTTRLSDAVISEFPLTAMESNSVKISHRYSILVKQKAITKEAFEFWTQLKKTSENLGGLFDPLPSQIAGNIKSVSGEPALGYFSGGTIAEKRIFIDFKDLPPKIRADRDPVPCTSEDLMVIPIAEIPSQPNSVYLVDPIYSPFIGIIAFTSASKRCVDCRAQGGVTQKPDFW